MSHIPLLVVHITGGIAGILSGTAAMSFRKGSRRHALAGKFFVASMLIMATSAVGLAILMQQTPNIIAGILTFYLITTAWLTARRGDRETSLVDWVALLIPGALGSWTWAMGVEKLVSHVPPHDGVPVVMNFFVGSVMLLAGAGDVRMMIRGGISGAPRVVRHLWRMCFGLFIATGSFFLGQQQVFPVVLRGSLLLVFLAILPLLFLVFWLFRVQFGNPFKGKPAQAAGTSQ